MSCLLTGVLLTVIMFLWNNVHKIVFLVPKVCYWLYGVQLGCGLWVGSWVQIVHFAMGWVKRLMGWVRLTDNSVPRRSGQCRMHVVANFIRFPSVQKFWKSVTIWQSYRVFKGGIFWDTVYKTWHIIIVFGIFMLLYDEYVWYDIMWTPIML